MSSRDTVHDLSQLLLERPESCYRTCTSAWHNKKRLDDFSELGMVEELQPGDQVELVEGGLRLRERGRGRDLREREGGEMVKREGTRFILLTFCGGNNNNSGILQ